MMNRQLTKGRLFRASAPALLAATLLASPAIAQQNALIRTVADGKPWSMAQTDGTAGQVTLMPDGKGRMVMGSMTASPTWRETENGQLCIKPMLIVPERCATLQRDGATIVGLNSGKVQFRLTRP